MAFEPSHWAVKLILFKNSKVQIFWEVNSLAKGHTIVIISLVIFITLKDFFNGTIPLKILFPNICFQERISRKSNFWWNSSVKKIRQSDGLLSHIDWGLHNVKISNIDNIHIQYLFLILQQNFHKLQNETLWGIRYSFRQHSHQPGVYILLSLAENLK